MDIGGGLLSGAAAGNDNLDGLPAHNPPRPTITSVDPEWQQYYHEAEKSSPKSTLGILSTLRRGPAQKRYQRSSDIVQEPDDEIDTTDKVVVVVSKTLSDKNSVPGHVYRELIEKFKERCKQCPLPNAREDSPDGYKNFTNRRRRDAKSIISLVTASFLETRPSFGNTKSLLSLTLSAVEIFVLMHIYELVMDEIRWDKSKEDANLTAKLQEMTPAIEHFEQHSNHLSREAIDALKMLPKFRSSLEKVKCCASLVDHISEQFAAAVGSHVMSADQLLKLVSQHLMVAQIPFLNTELAFLDSFAEDERYARGMEGYALVTVQAAVHYLNECPDLECDLESDWNKSTNNFEEGDHKDSPSDVNDKGWLLYRGQEVKSKSVKGVDIHESLKVIPKMAFFQWSRLTSVHLPDSLIEIQQRAFHSCSALKEVHLSDSILTIGDSAFCACVSLSSVRLPQRLDSIGDYFFYGCVSLQSIDIPPSVSRIGQNAFHGCSALTKLDMPNVVDIGDRAFRNCSSLTAIEIPSALSVINDSTFAGCSKLVTIHIPSNVNAIRRKAFFRCSGLSTFFLPVCLESIDAFAFQKAESLSTIRLPRYTLVDETAFEECRTLEEIRDKKLSLVEWLKRRYNDLPLHEFCYSRKVSSGALKHFNNGFDRLDRGSISPIHILSANLHVSASAICEIVQRLPDRGTALLCQDRQGRTPLHYLCQNIKASIDSFYTMLDFVPEACINLSDCHGKTCTAVAFDSLLSLPIRRLLYKYRPVKASELRLNADLAQQLVHQVEREYVNNLTFIWRNGDYSFGRREANGWVFFVSQVSDPSHVEEVLRLVERSSRETVRNLAFIEDFQGRTALEVAIPAIQTSFRKVLFFFETYHLLEEPIYRSKTCTVYATEGMTCHKKVVLKFFRNKSHFLEEARARLEDISDVKTARLVHRNVVQVVAIHDGPP